MRSTLLYLLLASFLALSAQTRAQRGLPPKQKTRAIHITKYPQHLDFLPQMASLLKSPKVASSR
ncbi:hypothetical protein [Pedobacter sp. GR22-6]|uniref:hypothetical protein n=1 Tax=Pedobacter sp. GR22-6 TaxID=3127957 RepID=UPI00307F75B5